MLLHVSNLTKRYGHLTALIEVSFSIRPGEVLGLIGPNGSGKTTLFECLGGVLPADGGSVSENGRALTPLSDDERKARVFYLPDAIAPWPTETVRWALDFIVGFFGDQRPTTNAQRPATTDVVRQLALDGLLDSPIGTLSKGQRKRALLAIGLLTPQPILLADEPFDGLDLRQTRDVAETLRSHAGAGRTMFLSIHQINDAARVCDRFVLLSGGRVCGEGTLDELSRKAAALDSREAGQAERGSLEEIFLALT
ncbi:MAG TPA: ABC transporter ATP-binding protein [Vicinamibacterales bacterium]|nr:ABC transporter ATP-binding protein [Vicinamibacterales bacterium]